MILLVLLFSLLIPSDSVDPYSEITDQVNFYLDGFEKDVDKDLNFWGINELYSSNCGQHKIVSRILSRSGLTTLKEPFLKYTCVSEDKEDSLKLERLKFYAIQTGSFAIATHYLTQNETESDLDNFYSDFLEIWDDSLSSAEKDFFRKVKNRNQISFNSINSGNKSFLYYSIVFSDYIHKYQTSNDLSNLLKTLLEEKKNNASNFQLSILNFSMLKVAYESNRYSFIYSIFKDLIESNHYPNSQKKVGVFSGLDYALSISGNYSESLYLQRYILLPLAEHYDLKTRFDYLLLQQGANLYELGKFIEAKDILENLYNDPNSSIPKSLLFNNLSLCYRKLGEQNKFTSFLLQAIQEVENNKSENPNYYEVKMGLYRNLFVYYNSIGDSSNAISYINRARKLSEDQNDENELSAIHLYLGDYYWENYKDSKKTLEEYNKAEQILQSIENYRRSIAVLLNKTSVYIEIDSLEKGSSMIEELRSIASSSSNTPLFIQTLIFEGKIASIENNFSKLDSVIAEINNYTLEDLDFEALVEYHNLVATFLHKKGEDRKAYAYFEPILNQVIDRARGSVESQSGFWTVEDVYLDSFELMISILSNLGHTQQAIAYLDKLKTINDASFYNNPLLKANKLTEKELAEEKKIGTQILSLRNEYLSANEAQKSLLKTEIDKLSAQRQLITNKLKISHSEKALPIWKLQQQMTSEELILHYTELNDKLYVSSISKTSSELSILDITDEVDSLLDYTANQLAKGSTSLVDLFKVYNFLNLENSLSNSVTHITVIPDNDLYRIPLDILPSGKPNSSSSFGSSRYLIEDYTFNYFTSLQDYAKNSHNTTSSFSNDFSAFAISYFDDFEIKKLPSLPFATQEAQNIQEVLTQFNKKKIFTGNNATEAAFQKQLSSSKILHVATHSEVSEQDPLFSTIYLKSSKNSGSEGDALYAYELFDHQLNNDLIMLNSCSSGTGNYLQGTGIMGISRALRYAGAKSLGLNLWEVNDKIASEFASSFYEYLNEGYSKTEAIRFAKINQINAGSADPHYWGAYTIIGNPAPVLKKPTNARFLLPTFVVVSLLIGYRIRKESEA